MWRFLSSVYKSLAAKPGTTTFDMSNHTNNGVTDSGHSSDSVVSVETHEQLLVELVRRLLRKYPGM